MCCAAPLARNRVKRASEQRRAKGKTKIFTYLFIHRNLPVERQRTNIDPICYRYMCSNMIGREVKGEKKQSILNIFEHRGYPCWQYFTFLHKIIPTFKCIAKQYQYKYLYHFICFENICRTTHTHTRSLLLVSQSFSWLKTDRHTRTRILTEDWEWCRNQSSSSSSNRDDDEEIRRKPKNVLAVSVVCAHITNNAHAQETAR